MLPGHLDFTLWRSPGSIDRKCKIIVVGGCQGIGSFPAITRVTGASPKEGEAPEALPVKDALVEELDKDEIHSVNE